MNFFNFISKILNTHKFVLIMCASLFIVFSNPSHGSMQAVQKFFELYKVETVEKTGIAKIASVNTFVNGFPYKTDYATYNTKNHWASPTEFIQNGGGDCEDIAMMKAHLLKNAGFDTVYVQFMKNKTSHVALAVAVNNKLYLLDDKNPVRLNRNNVQGFQFFKVQGHHVLSNLFNQFPTVILKGGKPVLKSDQSVLFASF